MVAVQALKPFDVIDDAVITGFLIVSCMPPAVSSAVVCTKAVGGNGGIAICANSIGSFIGLLITPVTLLLVTGIETNAPVLEITMKLCLTVVFPLLLGQVI